MTRALLTTIAALVLLITTGHGQEMITLTTPDAAASVTQLRQGPITLTPDDPGTAADEGHIHIQFVGVQRPITVNCTYASTTNPTGSFLITALNKANLSSAYAGNATTGSLKQRIHHRLVVMNEAPAVCGRSLAGTLTGSVP